MLILQFYCHTKMIFRILSILLQLCFLNSMICEPITDPKTDSLMDVPLDEEKSLNRIRKDTLILPGSSRLVSHSSLAHLLPEENSAFIRSEQSIHIPPDLKTNTFPFIEAIVRRTVNKYMNVIRTQSNWLELLLQLVREERQIRSRYNCFTDACIYKIQLFTSQLKLNNPAESLTMPGGSSSNNNDDNINNINNNDPSNNRRLKRPRRSTDFDTSSSLSSSPSAAVASNFIKESTGIDLENTKSIPSDLPSSDLSLDESIQILSDPTSAPLYEPNESNKNQLVMNEQLRELSNQQQQNQDDDALRLINDAETKHFKNHGNELKTNDFINTNQSRLQSTQIDTHSKIGVTRFSQEQNKFLTQQNTIPLPLKLNSLPMSGVGLKQDDEIELGESALPASPLSTLITSTPTVPPTIVPTNLVGSELEDGFDSNSHLDLNKLHSKPIRNSDTNESELTMDEQSPMQPMKEDNSDVIDESSQTIKSPIDLDPLVPVIPFGLNKFEGESYENCSGRYENYCYNAIKCVYISVLETAACYCRTGYTGVRCDMYNLPQTLDIFKSFGERIVDFNSMQKLNVFTVYSVVEATARYTVNAVLEEKLLTTWEDEGPF